MKTGIDIGRVVRKHEKAWLGKAVNYKGQRWNIVKITYGGYLLNTHDNRRPTRAAILATLQNKETNKVVAVELLESRNKEYNF